MATRQSVALCFGWRAGAGGVPSPVAGPALPRPSAPPRAAHRGLGGSPRDPERPACLGGDGRGQRRGGEGNDRRTRSHARVGTLGRVLPASGARRDPPPQRTSGGNGRPLRAPLPSTVPVPRDDCPAVGRL